MNKHTPTLETPIVFKILIQAPREKVFNGLATAKGLDDWFTTGSAIDREGPGGTLTLRWKDWGVDKFSDYLECPIIEYSFPESFSFKWWPDHYTTVRFKLVETYEGTVVSLSENGYARTNEGIRRCIDCSVGWGEALTLLKVYLEHGISYNVKN